jgi:predicted PurR-regulated permease PerM
MLLWGAFVVSGVDNFLKPYLISRGTSLPLLLVFLGVIGGVLAFGFLGIFLGPTLLAVGFALLREWGVRDQPSPPAPPDLA